MSKLQYSPTEWMNWHKPESADKREQDNAPYLKPSSDKKPEKKLGISGFDFIDLLK